MKHHRSQRSIRILCRDVVSPGLSVSGATAPREDVCSPTGVCKEVCFSPFADGYLVPHVFQDSRRRQNETWFEKNHLRNC